MARRPRVTAAEWGLVALITLVAAFLRFHALDEFPPGLYHDEAYNGLDALQVLQGTNPVFFESNNGREPMFIYLVAAAVAVLGRTPAAVRSVAAVLGTLTVPAAYLFFRTLYNRTIALLAAAALAITVWPIQTSRIGFRAVALPLFTVLALWQLWEGVRSGRSRHFVLGGAFYGLSFYTYLAARFTPLALAAFALVWAMGKRPDVSRRNALIFVAVALLVLAPLAAYVGTHWAAFSARAGQVSVFNPAINGGDLWGTLGRHIAKVAGMFNLRGDFIPRHNIPNRAVFDPVLGVAFLVGIAVALARRSEADLFALTWVGVMLLPTVLAEDAPHFLRGVGVLPVLTLFPAVGLDWAARQVQRRFSTRWAIVLLACALAASAGFTWRDYFVRYRHDPEVAFAFEAGAAELAAQTNVYLRTGWDGQGYAVKESEPYKGRAVFIISRIWNTWPSLRFLLADSDAVQVLSDAAEGTIASASHVRLVVWPYEPHQQHFNVLPPESAISVTKGPLERGDLEAEARLLCVTVDARPPAELPPLPMRPDATLGGRVRLAEAAVRSEGTTLHLTLHWQALRAMDTNYMVFVHVQQAEFPTSIGDGPPAYGYYTTDLWRAGDWVVDERTVELSRALDPSRDQILVGMYDLETLQRLPVTDSQGQPSGDSIALHMYSIE